MESQKVFYSINCAANKRDDTIFMIKLSNLRKIKHIKFVEKERPQCYLLTGRGHRTALTVVGKSIAAGGSAELGCRCRLTECVLCTMYTIHGASCPGVGSLLLLGSTLRPTEIGIHQRFAPILTKNNIVP